MFLLSISLIGGTTWACHKKDLGHVASGHFVWSEKLGGVSRYTEGYTVSTSIALKCDWYTQLLEDHWDDLKTEIAQGQGPKLQLLAQHWGCTQNALPVWQFELKKNYQKLWGREGFDEEADVTKNTINAIEFNQRVQVMIKGNHDLSQQCRA